MAERLPADLLAGHVGEWITDGLWNTTLVLGGVNYEAVGEDEYPGDMDDDDIVLRAPDGRMFKVEIEVDVSDWAPGGAR